MSSMIKIVMQCRAILRQMRDQIRCYFVEKIEFVFGIVAESPNTC